MTEIKLTAIYEKANEGGYIGYVVELPGANTQGETMKEVRANLKEVVELLLECYQAEAERHLATATTGATKETLILQAA